MAGSQAILVNGREFSVDAVVTIGRDESSDVCLDNDLVSRHHATLSIDERGWVYRDLWSANGTFLERARVSELVVTDDMQLMLGGVDGGATLALQPVGVSAAATRIAAPLPAAPRVAAPLPMEHAFAPTHQVPAAGMSTWDAPRPEAARGPRLAAGLDVLVSETRGEWAHVVCSNGWTAWVDRRLLVADVPLAPEPVSVAARPAVSPLVVAGVVAVIVGGFLPWFTGPGVSVNAWDIPLAFVMVDPVESGGPNVGPLLLVASVALIPAIRGRRPHPILLLVLAAAISAVAIGALNRVLTLDGGPDLGIGVIVTFAGALALAGEAWRTRSP
jgi:hypothetical protein